CRSSGSTRWRTPRPPTAASPGEACSERSSCGSGEARPARATGLQVPFLEDGAVVRDVAGGDVGQRPHREGVSAGDAAPAPGFVRKVAEESNRRQPDAPEFLDVVGPRALVCPRAGRGDVLVEARKRSFEPAGEPERPGDEEPFAVVDVVDDLADRPLLRRVGPEALLLGNRGEKVQG